MSSLPIVAGIYADAAGDFRTSYPHNMMPVPKSQGISTGYLRPADGILLQGEGPGIGRGGIAWNDILYRVMGSSLVSINQAGAVSILGDVGPGGPVTMDYSFDRLSIASAGKLYYWNGSALIQVTDSDLGIVAAQMFISGYFMTTDGRNLVVTELTDPTAVNPLKYGSSETDPDRVLGVSRLRNEAYALNRYTIEAFQNIGGDLFPFQRIDGALVMKGVIGAHAYCPFAQTLAFVGSGRNEAPAVYLVGAGNAQKISTRDVDIILSGYPETVLAECVVEQRKDRAHEHLLIHLPGQCLVFDAAASAVMDAPIWFVLHSGISDPETYRAKHLVWCYDRWNVCDPTSARYGYLSDGTSRHYGDMTGWQFSTPLVYAKGNDAIIHEMELVCLPGRVAFGDDPVVWASYSLDGETWSAEKPKDCGRPGERSKRLAWRRQGRIRHYRMQRFRGTSDARLSVAALEMQIEPLMTRGAYG